MNPDTQTLRGFTLVEMAIVLVAIAFLLGGGLTVLSAQIEQQRDKDSQRLLAEIQEALIGFATTNGRLPRPAMSATDGRERTTACATEADCEGFIPWATLGVNQIDPWGKIIRYSVTPAFAGKMSGTDPILLTDVPTKTVQTRNSTGTLSYLAGQATCTAINPCIPAVFFSHGKNNFGTDNQGNALANNSTGNTDEMANNAGPVNYFSRSYNQNATFTGGEFDDKVFWLSSFILFNRMLQAGRLQ